MPPSRGIYILPTLENALSWSNIGKRAVYVSSKIYKPTKGTCYLNFVSHKIYIYICTRLLNWMFVFAHKNYVHACGGKWYIYPGKEGWVFGDDVETRVQ